MNKYDCTKTVEAAKIIDISFEKDGSATFILKGIDSDNEAIEVDSAYVDKHSITRDSIGGYFVRYKDGYTSWSPAKAFEEGYSVIEDDVAV